MIRVGIAKMNDLRTLKDIPRGFEVPNYLVSEFELRKTVVEWVKELKKPCISLENPKGNSFLLKNNNEGEAKAQVRILVHIFDITEEDLIR